MSEQNQISGEFWIPTSNLEALQAKIGKLQKRALKIGAPEIVFTVTDEREKRQVGGVSCEDQGYWSALRAYEQEQGQNPQFANLPAFLPIYRQYAKVIVKGEAPKFNGWRLVARLLHDTQTGVDSDGKGTNIINTVPGQDVPQEYAFSGCKCDHCKKNWIVRKDTYVVGHDDGRYAQVGSNCLADFLGHANPEQLAQHRLAAPQSNADCQRPPSPLPLVEGLKSPAFFAAFPTGILSVRCI